MHRFASPLRAAFLGFIFCALALPVQAQNSPGKGKKVRSALRPATMNWPQKKKKTEPKTDEEPNPKTHVTVERDAKTKRKASKTTQKSSKMAKTNAKMGKRAKKAKKKVKKAKRNQSVVRVVGSYRPVDRRRATALSKHPGPLSQQGLDLYLSLGEGIKINAGQEFAVYRRVPAPTLKRATITLKVGEVQVVGIEGQLAVARVIGTPGQASHPYLKTPGVVVGDFIVSTRPLDLARYDPKPDPMQASLDAKRARQRALARRRRKMAADALAMKDKEMMNKTLNTNSAGAFDEQNSQAWINGQIKNLKPKGDEEDNKFRPPAEPGKRRPLPTDKDDYRNWDKPTSSL